MAKETTMTRQADARRYYDGFSRVYDLLSPDWYYRRPRSYAIESLGLRRGDRVLNLPCGTGQNLEYLQSYLQGTGTIVGVDLSPGMLAKARDKVRRRQYSNVVLVEDDAAAVGPQLADTYLDKGERFDAALCDLGLSGFPEWRTVIDEVLKVLRPGGTIVIMDWYVERPGLRAAFIEWIGGGEVGRPLYQYLAQQVEQFALDDSFKGGDVFVASGRKRALEGYVG